MYKFYKKEHKNSKITWISLLLFFFHSSYISGISVIPGHAEPEGKMFIS
jgi:hypothetical protein